jgi:WD40 repeat protein
MRPTPDLYTALVTAGDADLSTPLTGHTNSVHSVAFSPNGRTLASGSNDETVRLRNVTNPAHAVPLGQPLTGHTVR